MGLSIERRDVGDVVVLDMSGESNIMEGTVLQNRVRELTNEGKRLFVLNLKDVRHLDSFGLGQLVATFMNIQALKGDLRIVNPSRTIKDLFKYTRIESVLKVPPSEAEAVQELQKLATP